MTIKQQGGIFGRNPSFNDVTATNTTTTDLTVANGDITLSTNDVTSGLITQGAVSEGANRMAIGNGDTGVWFLDNLESIVPFNPAAGTSRGSAINLGFSSIPFANLYLSGNVKVGDGSGIDFSATSGTGTSELFDDYEEGTWTPTLGGTATYWLQSGIYTKVGRLVHVTGSLVVNVLGTGSTTTISGLPFPSTGSPADFIGFPSFNTLASNVVYLAGSADGSSNIVISSLTSAGTAMSSNPIFQNSTRVDFAGTYATS